MLLGTYDPEKPGGVITRKSLDAREKSALPNALH
jgi:hypothetical protein